MKDKMSHNFYKNNLVPLRIASAISIVGGTWSLIFEVYFFKGFQIEIYFARVAFTVIASIIFLLSYREFVEKHSTYLIHLLLISLISSFLITIYKIPNTVFINSQLLSLLIFTSAIVFSWEVKQQIIVAIYYNLLFAASIFYTDRAIFQFPNLFSMVLFVCFISFLSVATSAVTFNLRKKYRMKSEEINFLFSNAPIGICRIDLVGNVLTSNRYFDMMIDAGNDSKSKNFFSFLNDLQLVNIIKTETLENSRIQQLNCTVENQSLQKYLKISTKLIKSEGMEDSIECLIIDETQERRIEKLKNDALRKLFNETREKEKLTKKALMEKNQKIKLLAKINHEVRTPINSILSFFELIELNMLKSIEEVKDFASSVKLSAESLLQTINNFIDFTKIEAGKLTIDNELFNIKDVLESVVVLLNPLCKMKGNKLSVRLDNLDTTIVYTDVNKYRQILINLVGNSNKFTANGEIIISVSTQQGNENNYEIVTKVRDTGVGIPQDKINEIFAPYESKISGLSKESSSGLGLTICKEFLEMMKGKINVRSKVNFGSEFEFIIPFKYKFLEHSSK
ncbi:MAG: hypothetical protein JW995_09625 [Melioribacteraceae bacterium]|nr:hypothetical protein [Melioribacteraceae bacterium]